MRCCSTGSARYARYMALGAPVKVCAYCKGVGVVFAPTSYAMPLKAVHSFACVPCRDKGRLADDGSAPRSSEFS